MADIKPFRAIRPAEGYSELIASLPYDVFNREEAYLRTRGDEHSFLRIDRPETQFAPDYDMYAPEVYQKASQMLSDQIKAGEFIQDEKPCFYVYSQTMDGRTQTGIVAVSSVQDYLDNIIKKHENTREDKEIDRIKHVDTCNAQTGPIFLAYRKSEIISSIISEAMKTAPIFDFEKENVRQRGWIIDKEDEINAINAAFSKMDSIYIADGHHRCASACKVAVKRRLDPNVPMDTEAEHFLSVLFPDEELMIMDYNRVVKDLNGMTKDEFLKIIGNVYKVSESDVPVKPEKKGECGLLLQDKWFKLEYDQSKLIGDPVKDLDVAILQDKILSPYLGIDDPKTNKRIDFVGGIRGLAELERRCKSDCIVAFAMYPTDIHELFDVADAGLLMPPKSTWFEPKLLSGLYIHDIS